MTQSAVFGAVPTGSGAQVRQDLNLCNQALATEHAGESAPSVTYPNMRWRKPSTDWLYRRDPSNATWYILEARGQTTDPTVNDDAADGYIRGAMWINGTDDRIFFCADTPPVPRSGCRSAAAAAALPRYTAAPARWWRSSVTTPPTRSPTAVAR